MNIDDWASAEICDEFNLVMDLCREQMVGTYATHTPIGGNMLRMTRSDRLSLAVAEAAVAHHLGIEKHSALAEFVDLRPSWRLSDYGRTVVIRTFGYHNQPSQQFVVEVGHKADAEYEYEAHLFQNELLLRKFYWTPSGPDVFLMESSEV